MRVTLGHARVGNAGLSPPMACLHAFLRGFIGATVGAEIVEIDNLLQTRAPSSRARASSRA